jgi:hypothetical protein
VVVVVEPEVVEVVVEEDVVENVVVEVDDPSSDPQAPTASTKPRTNPEARNPITRLPSHDR